MQAVAAGIDTGISFQVKVMLDVKDAGKIFGQGGSVLRRVQHVSGCTRIHFSPSKPGSDHRTALLQGSAPSIVIGLSMFSLLLCGEVMKTVSSISLLINKKHVGQIIGKAGARINQIRKESGAEILISTDRFLDEDGLSEDNKITVRGPPMAVSKGISRVIYHLQQAVEDAVRYGRAQESYEPPHPSNHQREYQSSRTGGGGGGYKRDRSPSRRGERGYYTDDINRSAAGRGVTTSYHQQGEERGGGGYKDDYNPQNKRRRRRQRSASR